MVKSSESKRLVVSKRCKDLASFMENIMEDTARSEEELRLEVPDEISLSVRKLYLLYVILNNLYLRLKSYCVFNTKTFVSTE